MAPRVRLPRLAEELPDASLALLASYNIDIRPIQAWLDNVESQKDPKLRFDGASGVLDVFLAAEAVHDWLYRTPGLPVTRREADYIFWAIMDDMAKERELHLFGQFEGRALAWIRWAGVRVGGSKAGVAWHTPARKWVK